MALDIKKIVAELPRQDWSVERTGGGHFKATPPDKTKSPVVFSTSDDPHAQRNIIRDLTVRGFVWPPLSKKERTQQMSNDVPSVPKTDPFLRPVPRAPSTPNFVPFAMPQPPAQPPADPVAEKTEEQLWGELKEARTYQDLTMQEVARCKTALEEATRALSEADRENKRAIADLAQKRTILFERFP